MPSFLAMASSPCSSVSWAVYILLRTSGDFWFGMLRSCRSKSLRSLFASTLPIIKSILTAPFLSNHITPKRIQCKLLFPLRPDFPPACVISGFFLLCFSRYHKRPAHRSLLHRCRSAHHEAVRCVPVQTTDETHPLKHIMPSG